MFQPHFRQVGHENKNNDAAITRILTAIYSFKQYPGRLKMFFLIFVT